MFRIEMLPAQQGDTLWIEYGAVGSTHRVLVDGGTPPTYKVLKARLDQLPHRERTFELLIVTHIDTDHIGGMLKLLADDSLGLRFDDVWFNGWRHLPKAKGKRGPIDGAILQVLIEELAMPWNDAFGGGPVITSEQGSLPQHRLPGGMGLTLLSPGPTELARLRAAWASVLREAGLDPEGPSMDDLAERARKKGVRMKRRAVPRPDVNALAEATFVPDTAVANGSTIAVLAEYDGRSCLLGGDGFPEVIGASLRRLAQERDVQRLAIDAVKVPHHGSKHNVSSDMLEMIRSSRYLFSTDGGAGFGHPDQEAVARVVCQGGPQPTLLFNYHSSHNAIWDDRRLMNKYGYKVVYPEAGQEGLRVELEHDD